MALTFHTTHAMVDHLFEIGKSMMMLPMPMPCMNMDDFWGRRRELPDMVNRLEMCVVGEGTGTNDEVRSNLEAISRGDLRVPMIFKDVLGRLAEFGHDTNLIHGFNVKFPGSSFPMGMGMGIEYREPWVVPIGDSVENDDLYTHLGKFYLNKTIKACAMGEDGRVCHGDRLVMLVRVKPHLLFGLIVSMGVFLEKDIL